MNSINQRGYNTLHTAAKLQYSYVLEILAAHKSGIVRNLVWDEQYLERRTEDEHKLSALQIACRNEDKESVEVLLKYLNELPDEQQTAEERHLKQIHSCDRCVVPAKNEEELQQALSLIKAQGIHTEKREKILRRAFPVKRVTSYKYNMLVLRCTCKHKDLVELSDRHITKCLNCIEYSCFSQKRDYLVNSLMTMDADISVYVLHTQLHVDLHKLYTRCAMNMLLCSFGMKGLSHDHFTWLVQFYWRNVEYEALSLLYVSVNCFSMYQSIVSDQNEQVDQPRADAESSFRDCILETTHLGGDMSGLSSIQYLKYAAKQPRTLKNCCIISIRRSISSNVVRKAEHLPIPLKLKKEVKLAKHQKTCSAYGVCNEIIIE